MSTTTPTSLRLTLTSGLTAILSLDVTRGRYSVTASATLSLSLCDTYVGMSFAELHDTHIEDATAGPALWLGQAAVAVTPADAYAINAWLLAAAAYVTALACPPTDRTAVTTDDGGRTVGDTHYAARHPGTHRVTVTLEVDAGDDTDTDDLHEAVCSILAGQEHHYQCDHDGDEGDDSGKQVAVELTIVSAESDLFRVDMGMAA